MKYPHKAFVTARTARSLGLLNLARVVVYRLGLRSGLHPVCRLRARLPGPPYFACPAVPVEGLAPHPAWNSRPLLFDWFQMPADDQPPAWRRNPFTGAEVGDPQLSWWRIPDFDPQAGDIKAVWEASRFHWALTLAQAAAGGEQAALARLNDWLADWRLGNPAYCGPNWKCGQEAAIRVMHLAMASLILRQERQPLPGLLALIEVHLRRIAPTLSYALAQDNNHGTSEAAALWIGGSWLAANGHAPGQRWERLGRRWLENRVRRLIQEDGSFSQYSLNYHRLLLDTLSMVEVWRQRFELPRFSPTWDARARAATRWLFAFVDPRTGDAPNLGTNDGARLLPLTDADYRDYRPSVQLASVLFEKRRAYGEAGKGNQPLAWLGLPIPKETVAPPASALFEQGGYALLRRGRAMCLVRYPRFRFRPGHADALHVDLWIDGINHWRDSGSFSYHAEPPWSTYFSGTVSHNTVQFDDRDQMPRLSRFLFGDWLVATDCEASLENGEAAAFSAGYQDGWQARHHRRVSLSENSLQVEDRIAGFQRHAVLRWRLKPGAWKLEGRTLVGDGVRLEVDGSMPLQRFELVEGWESRYYLQKTALPVLEVEVHEAGLLETRYTWDR